MQIVHVSIAITKALIEDQEVPLPTNRSILAVVKVSSHGINQFIVTKNTHLWPLLVVASCTFTQDEVLDRYQGISIFHQHSSQAWSSLWTAILSKKTNKKNIPKSYSWYISNPLSTLGGKKNIPSHISCILFPWGKNVLFLGESAPCSLFQRFGGFVESNYTLSNQIWTAPEGNWRQVTNMESPFFRVLG